eukprot:m51a1_g9272 hypothetical protein (131) ;mRNA; f:95210-95879
MRHEAEILQLLNTSVKDLHGIPRLMAVLDQDVGIIESPRALPLGRGTMDDRHIRGLFPGLVRVLHEAHVRSIVHRDVRPENILIPDMVLPPRTDYRTLREFWNGFKILALDAALAANYEGLAHCFTNWHL